MNKELIEELKTQDFNVVAVSKTRTKEEIDEVAKMGLTTFGENRVQEFIDKYDPIYLAHYWASTDKQSKVYCWKG